MLETIRGLRRRSIFVPNVAMFDGLVQTKMLPGRRMRLRTGLAICFVATLDNGRSATECSTPRDRVHSALAPLFRQMAAWKWMPAVWQ